MQSMTVRPTTYATAHPAVRMTPAALRKESESIQHYAVEQARHEREVYEADPLGGAPSRY